MTAAQYVLDNAWYEARARLAGLEAAYDPGTQRHLDALGIGPGWHCLEVGGGGGSIVEWLAQRVETTGTVVATDIDTRFLAPLAAPHIEVRQHNIVTDELETANFDLIHIRNVLHHLAGTAQRDMALRRLVAALKPGGWLLAEEPDSVSFFATEPHLDDASVTLWRRFKEAGAELYRARGADATYGRQLYRAFHKQGLSDVAGEGRLPLLRGGSTEIGWIALSYTQVRDNLLETGLLTGDELDQVLTCFASPDYFTLGLTEVATWGRKPAS